MEILFIGNVVEVLPGPAVLDHGDLKRWVRHGEEISWYDEPVIGPETDSMDEQPNAQSINQVYEVSFASSVQFVRSNLP